MSREIYGEFVGRCVVVLGGGGGIGSAVVDAFHWLGARVAIVDRNGPKARFLAKKLTARSAKPKSPIFAPQVFPADLTQETRCRGQLRKLVKTLGPPRAVVSTVGKDDRVAFGSVRHAKLRQLVEINGIAPILAVRQLAPAMRADGGTICLFTSRHGTEIFESNALGYAGGKAFLEVGIQNLALELGSHNTRDKFIRVFGFCPGWVWTESQRRRFPAKIEAHRATQLIPIEMSAKDLVPSVIHLSSVHARLFTGRIHYEDGGEGRRTRDDGQRQRKSMD